MIQTRIFSASRPGAIALAGLMLASISTSATAGVVFSESFEAPVVSGFASNTVPSGGKWIGATLGFGASDRGLYNETVAWPATPAFTTPYGAQAYLLNYSNSGLTTAVGATGQTLTAGVTYKVSFNAAVATGTASYLVELVAFAAADDNAARTNCQSNRVGTVLATATGTVTTNTMSGAGQIVFTPTVGNANLGKDLGIRLIKSTNSVLYDNIRLVTGHDMLPSPPSGADMPAGNIVLSWTNMPPTTGTDVYADVWFGTNPSALTKVVNGALNTSTTNVTAPGAGTYYWRVDSYLNGSAIGTPVTGDVFFFTVSDSDSDGLPDAYELANTTPSSATGLNPAADLEPDGLTNLQEYQYGTNPNNSDTDGDTLLDGPELTGVGLRPATSPVDADSDDDGLSDGVETNTGAWVSAANTGTNPKDADRDKDGLKDGAETNTGTLVDRFNTGSNPYLADTDADGAMDWYEVAAAFTNPSSAAEKPSIPYPLPDPDGSTGATNKPVKVYIMAGQSNTVGIGQTMGTALGTLETIVKRENKFPNLVDGSNNWTKRNDVIYKGVVSATAAGPLTAGQGASNVQLGPELGFGQVMGWYHDEPVLIIKASQGNRSLAWDFLPPGGERWVLADKTYAGYGESPANWLTATGAPAPGGWYAGKQYDDCFRAESQMGMIPWATATVYASGVYVRHNGAAYTSKSAHTADASSEPGIGASWATYWTLYTTFNAYDILANGVLQNLPTTGNNLNGRTYEIAGFCWWQGHKDQDGSNNIYAPRYEANLVKLINALRADFNAPNAPFVVASIGFGGEPLSTKENDFKQVYNAQMAVGNPTLHPEFAGTVKSVDILKYWRTIAESPKNQDYHYNQNAETYMLVGDAMGRAMLEMQNDTSPPSPNPMTFAIAPTAVNTGTVGMVGTTAIDVSGPVEYYFENTSNSTNSGWISGTQWNNTGLSNGVSYNFRVKARDSKGNETDWSATASAAPGNDVTFPSPNPMSFATLPTTQGENAISMTATTATDINGVQYYFACTVGSGTDSGWQSSPEFTATGLAPGTQYTYVVRAKDSAGNTTADSAAASATTTAPDTTPPSPATMSFATPPAALGIDSVAMTATTATDPSGVEYYFEEISGNPGGTASGWQNSPTYTDSGLDPGTQYTYRARARDKSPAQSATAWSAGASATTALPDTTPPAVSSLSPALGAANVAAAANLSVTFNEEITIGTGLITLKNLTDATQSTIDIADGSQVSAAGAVLTINPTVNLAYDKNYAIQIAATAIKDLEENYFPGVIDDTTWAFTTVSAPVGPGGAVIYEPFADSNSTLTGNAVGTGLSGTWLGNGTVTAGSLGYGSFPAGSGNKASFNNTNGYASVGSTLTNAGLLADGATLWFSFVVTTGSDVGTNGDLGFVLGTDQINSGNNIAISNSGNAMGVRFKNDQLRAAFWSPSILQSAGGSIAANTTYLVAGKFTWGATSDKVEVYKVAADLTIGAAVSTYTSAANVVQQNFDTISIGSKTASPAHLFDEIRFGATYADVIGQGGAGPGPVASFTISPITTPQTVGTPITGITLTAKDVSNATATGFTGTVSFGGTAGVTGTSASFVAGVLSGVSVTPTAAGSNLTLTVSDGASHTGSTNIANVYPALSAYETWAVGAAFDADSNKDGIANGMAWVLGASNPSANATSLLPTISNADPTHFIFTCRRADAANTVPGTTIAVQYGGSLSGWTTAVHDGDNIIITPTDNFFGTNPGIDKVEVRIKRTLAPGGKIFMRLNVTTGP